MTIVLTASGIGRDEVDFHQAITGIIGQGDIRYDSIISWHMDTDIQVISDLLDNRHGQRVIGEVANQIYDTYVEHHIPLADFVIISHSAGSRLVEEALAMLYESKGQLPVKHIMMAPAIGGNDWAKIGSVATSLITAVLTGAIVLSDDDTSLEDFITELLEIESLDELVSDEAIVNKLSKGLDQMKFDIPPNERYIIYGTDDKIVDTSNPDLPGKTVLFKGAYNHTQIGDLSDTGLDQLYERNNGFLTQLKNLIFGENLTKREIIRTYSSSLIDL